MRPTEEPAEIPRRRDESLSFAPRSLSPGVVIAAGLGIAAVLALTVSAQTYLSMRTHGHAFARIFLWQLAGWSFWAAAAPFVLRAGGRLPGDAGRNRFLRPLALGALLLAAHALITAQCSVWIQPFVPVMSHGFVDSLVDQLGLLLVVDVLAFTVVLLAGSALAVYDRARLAEVRESRLEAQLTRAHLDALRLEIQPHFLFNTLNAIAALIRRKAPEPALDMLIDLSDLLRGTLDHRRANMATLESEMAFVRKYVDLYRARFSDRLEVVYHLDPGALRQPVPTFMLQPLVENAFRHGLARRTNGSLVEIGARVENGSIRLWVADNGTGISPDFEMSEKAGTGLSNVRSRLHCLFGAAARLEVRPRETGGTVASIVLPIAAASAIRLAAS
jgi:two-component system, LytTR family, sensor kinase